MISAYYNSQERHQTELPNVNSKFGFFKFVPEMFEEELPSDEYLSLLRHFGSISLVKQN